MLDVRLDSGRAISASAIHLDSAYAGLIEGLPDEAHNREILAGVPAELAAAFALPARPDDDPARTRLDALSSLCRRLGGKALTRARAELQHGGFVVIPPVFTQRQLPARRGGCTVHVLPSVRVMALFKSTPVRDTASSGSALAVAWFQGDATSHRTDAVAQTYILAPEIEPAIRSIDWDARAWDYWD